MQALRVLRHIAGGFLTLFMLLLMLLSAAVIFVQTRAGLDWLGTTISRAASSPDMRVQMNFARVGLTRIIVPQVQLADHKGVFLTVDDIDLAVDISTYWRLTPVIDSLVVSRVQLDRLPENTAAAETTAPSAPLPAFLADIRQFDIHQIDTGAAVYGDAQSFTFKSRMQISTHDVAANDVDILLTAVNGAAKQSPTHAAITIQGHTDNQLRVAINLRDAAGGMLTRLAGLPAGYDLDATLTGDGPADSWQGQAQLRLGQELSGRFDLQFLRDSLTIQADLKGPKGVVVKGDITLPASLSPPALRMNDEMRGQWHTVLDLRSLTLLLGLDDHRLTGKAALNLRLSGTLSAPVVEGGGNIRQASYENMATGVRLSGLSADVVATRSAVRLENLSARTAKQGTVRGQAVVSLSNMSRLPYDFSLSMNKANLLALDNRDVQISGDLMGKGDITGVDVTGALVVNRAEIYLAGLGSGSAAGMLNIREVNVPKHLRRSRQADVAVRGNYRIGLDITVDAPRAIYVRAQGLDSEWSAKLHIRGTAAEPVIEGFLKLLRGRYEFFDALLTLESGLVDFSTGDMSNPALDIKGSLKGREVTANIGVTGTALAPDVSLTSTPALPQDEILAKVLFNKNVTELTPMELVRIAQIIGVMSGKTGGGMDPISQLRKKAGIDMLSLNRDDKTGATSVSVGKYLADGIYVSVDQGVNSEGSAVKLQMELSPNLQLETRVGNDADNSVGINWKKDY